jgi:hypothetical protein
MRISVVSMAAAGLLLSACGAPPESGATGGEQSSAPATPPTEVTARALGDAFKANEVAAQQQYGGKPLAVTGRIESIELDMFDNPTLQLRGASEFEFVSLNLGEEGRQVAASLSKGQEIRAVCGDIGEVIGMPILNDCRIESQAAAN